MKGYAMLFGLLLCQSVLIGCDDTARGMSKDTGEAASEIKDEANKAGVAASLTPDIKTALVANPYLNEDGNVIDVDSTPEAVTLKGHVKTEKNRALAEDIARKVIKDNGSTLPLRNEITVR